MRLFNRKKKKKITDNKLYAPVAGTMIDIAKVSDQVFSTKMMGDGVAFVFDGDTVCAPCDGKLTLVANTGHAFGMKMDNGTEVLVHVGMDTVNLGGKGLDALIAAGVKVKKGTPIIRIDREFMKYRDVDLTTPMVITNSSDYEIDKIKEFGKVEFGEALIETSFKQ